MSPEGLAITKAFLRRWSTVDFSEEHRITLKDDVMNVKAMLKIYGDDPSVLDGAEHAPDRAWFAKKHKELRG